MVEKLQVCRHDKVEQVLERKGQKGFKGGLREQGLLSSVSNRSLHISTDEAVILST